MVYLKLNSNLTGHLAFLSGKPGHSPWSPTPGSSGVTVSWLLPGAGSTLKDIGTQSTMQISKERGSKANVWAPEHCGHVWGDLSILPLMSKDGYSRAILAPLSLGFLISYTEKGIPISQGYHMDSMKETWKCITQRVTPGRGTTNVCCVLNEIPQPQNDCISTAPGTKPISWGSPEAGTGVTCESTIMGTALGTGRQPGHRAPGEPSGSQFRGRTRTLAFYTFGAGCRVCRMLFFLIIEIYLTNNIVCLRCTTRWFDILAYCNTIAIVFSTSVMSHNYLFCRKNN